MYCSMASIWGFISLAQVKWLRSKNDQDSYFSVDRKFFLLSVFALVDLERTYGVDLDACQS